jgi:Fe-S-cluster-containing hydrogenase component 2
VAKEGPVNSEWIAINLNKARAHSCMICLEICPILVMLMGVEEVAVGVAISHITKTIHLPKVITTHPTKAIIIHPTKTITIHPTKIQIITYLIIISAKEEWVGKINIINLMITLLNSFADFSN